MDYPSLNNVYPSVWYMCKYVLRKIITHPLIIKPNVVNIDTGEPVYIEKFKIYNGLHLDPESLALSIFPQSQPGDGFGLARPNEMGVSAFIDDFEVGQNQEKITYLIGVKLHYNTIKISNKYTETSLAKVPRDVPLSIRQEFLTEIGERTIDLEINPALPILSEYCELIRLALLDQRNYPMLGEGIPGTFQVKSFNIKEGRWEEKKNIYFQEAEMLVMVDMLINRNWASNLDPTIECFKIKKIIN